MTTEDIDTLPNGSPACIEAHDLTLRYGDTTAIDGLSFRFAGPGILGLLGRNGSGKSTLLSVLAAFRKASDGRVSLDGEPIFENPEAMRRICLIREGGDTVESGEMVEAALRFASEMRPQWDGDFARHLLERFGLPLKKKVCDLSRGQRAQLACTLGLASRAPLTMFDEAYLGMDAPSRYAFYDELLRDYMEHPRTFVVSTHLIEEVANLFDQVLIIDQGRVLLQDDADTFRSHGVTITGPARTVDEFAAGMSVLSAKQLGPTKSAVLYGRLSDEDEKRARRAGLEVGPLPLQDLFVHLTAAEVSTSDGSDE